MTCLGDLTVFHIPLRPNTNRHIRDATLGPLQERGCLSKALSKDLRLVSVISSYELHLDFFKFCCSIWSFIRYNYISDCHSQSISTRGASSAVTALPLR